MQIKLSVSTSHSILTPGQPVPALTLTQGTWQGSPRSTSSKVSGMTRPGKIPTKNVRIEPGSAALEADAVTTWPTRLCDVENNTVLPLLNPGHVAGLEARRSPRERQASGYSIDYSARCLMCQGQLFDWSTRCQYIEIESLICNFCLSVATRTIV